MRKRSGETRRYGVLLTGTSRVGKSAIGAEAALSCFARGLLCVYMPSALEWLDQAKNDRGDAFLLHQLLQQNVDLIVRKPALRASLAPLLVMAPDEVLALDSHASFRIRRSFTCALSGGPEEDHDAMGLIVNEAQLIRAAYQTATAEDSTATARAHRGLGTSCAGRAGSMRIALCGWTSPAARAATSRSSVPGIHGWGQGIPSACALRHQWLQASPERLDGGPLRASALRPLLRLLLLAY